MTPEAPELEPRPPADAIACVLEEAQARRARGEPFALVSVVRAVAPTSARPGDKAIVTAEGIVSGWIGGGCAQPAVVRTVREALADGRARLIRIAPTDRTEVRDVTEALGEVLEFGMSCHSGGTLELFVDPLVPAARLVVVGDAPVALALGRLAPQVGFEVQVQTPAETAEAGSAQGAAWTAGAWVVVATQGRRDLPALRAALAARAQRVWFVASARKAEVLRASLVAGGADAAAVAGIVAPAGQAIGAVTPEEIALSVLAAVIAARRGRGEPAGTAGRATAATTTAHALPEALPRVAGDPDAVRARLRERLARARGEATGTVGSTPAAAAGSAGDAPADAPAAVATAERTTGLRPAVPPKPTGGSCCGG